MVPRATAAAVAHLAAVVAPRAAAEVEVVVEVVAAPRAEVMVAREI